MKREAYSISRRLSLQLAAMTLAGLGVLSAGIYWSVAALIGEKQRAIEASMVQTIEHWVKGAAAKGGEQEVILKLQMYAPRRPGSHLQLARADGSVLHRDADELPFRVSEHAQRARFDIATPQIAGGVVRADLLIDVTEDVHLRRGVMLTLVMATLVGGALAYVLTLWRVRTGMAPLRDIVRQTRAVSPRRLDQRLSLAVPVEELEPWIGQFNALLARLEAAYRQLEGFNADVAHELRTPLCTLIGQTEVALSRSRPAEALRETLSSNLEELQRLAAMVNDMLFLASADRGAQASRSSKASLAELASQVIDFHEAALTERALSVAVRGDAVVPIDEPLFKRAISNLLGNAVRFADHGSEIVIEIDAEAPDQVRVLVQNHGLTIEPSQLPRLFDRFFRAESSRSSDGPAHHGLGLSIVAAIARMHSGRTFAQSDGGVTRLGFTVAAH